MSQREPFDYVEIDMDYCALTYSTSPCAAVLGTTGQHKCFNTFRTCQDQDNFDTSTKTLRFCRNVAGIPLGEQFFPVMSSVSKRSASVNIGGTDEKLAAFGRRATLNIDLRDFPYHDRFVDKYQSERLSGAAQLDGVGYNPEDNGTFFGKLLARWPYYAGRSIRHTQGYLVDGAIVVDKTAHFIITDFQVNDTTGKVTIKARDPLDIASNENALVPAPVNGALTADVSSAATTLTLTPTGIGDSSYPASGRAAIGDEYVAFTRSGDVITLTERGIEGTSVSSHDAGDKFQPSFSLYKERLDVALKSLLVDFAGLDEAFIPDDEWAAELDRWASGLVLTVDIIEPESVADIISEIAILGLSVWWDEVTQKVRLKTIRPVDGDTLFVLTDDNSIKEISFEDRDGDRLTEVLISTVLSDPTQDPTDSKNYKRGRYIVDVLSKSEHAFADTRYREINCRLLNHGDDRVARRAGRRIVDRLKTSPRRYKILLDAKDAAIGLTDVLQVRSRSLVDETGRQVDQLMQVIEIQEARNGHDFYVLAQAYSYDDRFGFIMDSAAPTYDLATDEQREGGFYIVDSSTLKFSDGTGPYVII